MDVEFVGRLSWDKGDVGVGGDFRIQEGNIGRLSVTTLVLIYAAAYPSTAKSAPQ